MLSKSSPTNEPTISILNCYKPGLTPENAGVVWGSQQYFIHRGLNSFEGHPKVPTQKLTLGRSHVQNKHKTLLWRLSWFTSKLILLEYQISSQCCFWWTWRFCTNFFGANVDGFSARLLQGLSTKPWAKMRFHGCPKVVRGGRPPKIHPGPYVLPWSCTFSLKCCQLFLVTPENRRFFGRFKFINCRSNVMITNSWFKIFPLPFLGSDLNFFVEHLLRNTL